MLETEKLVPEIELKKGGTELVVTGLERRQNQ